MTVVPLRPNLAAEVKHGSRQQPGNPPPSAEPANAVHTPGTQHPELVSPSHLTVRTRLLRCLPLAILATTSVVAAPVVLAAAVFPGQHLLIVAATVVISIGLASLERAGWRLWVGSRDITFADLMLWGWVSRWRAEGLLDHIGCCYEAATSSSPAVRLELLEGLSRLLERRDPSDYGHCRRVARYAERIARAMDVSPAGVAKIRSAALVHDVGKVYAPREVLLKNGPLTDEELAIVGRLRLAAFDVGPSTASRVRSTANGAVRRYR